MRCWVRGASDDEGRTSNLDRVRLRVLAHHGLVEAAIADARRLLEEPDRSAVGHPMLKRLSIYLSFVRFSHSVFALPFALAGALLASRHVTLTWSVVLWIVVAMVAARSAAMGFNRLVDARMDALNPRTANRELPRGAMT